MSNVEGADDLTGLVINSQDNKGILRQAIRNPRLRIERIGVVGQQLGFCRYLVGNQFWQLNPTPLHIFGGYRIPQRLHTDKRIGRLRGDFKGIANRSGLPRFYINNGEPITGFGGRCNSGNCPTC